MATPKAIEGAPLFERARNHLLRALPVGAARSLYQTKGFQVQNAAITAQVMIP
jgi:hypothetical protein